VTTAHGNRQQTRSVAAPLILIIAAGLAGCADFMPAPSAGVSAQDPKILASAQEPAAKYSDPLEVSKLREQALDLLIKMTTDQSPQIRGNALEAMLVTPQRLEPLLARPSPPPWWARRASKTSPRPSARS
jgi:hypothetical protein